MSFHKSYAVFGLGRYGLAVAKELVNHGAEVLAVDHDQTIVNSAIADIPFCKCADVTNAEVIDQLGIANIDVVIVAMANNLEASVLAVMLCKEAGVKTVIAKCANETNRKILTKVGADKVVFPESESGTRLAKNLLSSGFIDVIELSQDVSLIDLDVKPEWVGKTLVELNLRKKYTINVVAIRKDDILQTNVDPTAKLESDMRLVVIINTAKLQKLK
ncbi:MAG: TrkA family potassium uptake protein [Clostridia bacterium]|nr:TrkA family potassium uptake protein [Clostridia bacterium]MBR3862341.1 TrkA family potassium uptake protein [Clostridia bacterium]